MHELNLDDIRATQTICLGKRPTKSTDKPRTVKVMLQTEEQRDRVLKEAKKT